MASPSTKSVDSFEILTPIQSPGQEPQDVTDTSENVKVTSTSDANTTSIHQMTSLDPSKFLASGFAAAEAESVKPKMKEKTLVRGGPHHSSLTTDSNILYFTEATMRPKQTSISQSDGAGKRSVALHQRGCSDPKLSFFAESTPHASATPEQVQQMNSTMTAKQVKQMSSAITAERIKLMKDLLSTMSADCTNPPSKTETVTEEDSKQAANYESSDQFESKLDGHNLDRGQDDELPHVDYPLSQQILDGEVYSPISAVGHAVEGVFDSYFASEPIRVIVGTDIPKTYYVHKDNLAISPVLERLSRKGTVESSMCLNLPEDDPFDFEYVVSYLYNEQTNAGPLGGNDNRLTDVYILASKYELVEMQRQIRGFLDLNCSFQVLCETVVKVYFAGAADELFRALVKGKVVPALQKGASEWCPFPAPQDLAPAAQLHDTLALDITQAMINEIQNTAIMRNDGCWGGIVGDDEERYSQTCGRYHSGLDWCRGRQDCPVVSPPPPSPPGGWSNCQHAANDAQVSYDLGVLREELAVLTNRINQMEVDKVRGNVPHPHSAQSTAGPVKWGQPAYVPPPQLPPFPLQPPPVQCYTSAAPPYDQTVTAVKASSGEDCTLSFPKGANITNTVFVSNDTWATDGTWQGTYNGQSGTFPNHYIEVASGWD